MSISQSMLPEFDAEMANTRKLIERIPDEKLDWKAHEKSYSLRDIATHLSNLLTWTNTTIESDEFDMAPADNKSAARVEPVASVAEALTRFDANVASARRVLEGASDETLMGSWTLLAGGEKQFTLPKVVVLRSFVMNHMIHHRGQLDVYLRLNDVPLPAIYGPSADESPQM
jgi:uncharacterized damage-inducible protein DinB